MSCKAMKGMRRFHTIFTHSATKSHLLRKESKLRKTPTYVNKNSGKQRPDSEGHAALLLCIGSKDQILRMAKMKFTGDNGTETLLHNGVVVSVCFVCPISQQ